MSDLALFDPPATAGHLSNPARYRSRKWAEDIPAIRTAALEKMIRYLVRHADPDGHNAYVSVPTLAKVAGVDERTVQNYLRLAEALRWLMVDPTPPPARYLRSMKEGRRPTRYVVLIPASAWSAAELEQINAYRAELGREPITAANRPALAPQPARKTRSDKGVPNPKRGRPKLAAAASAPLEPAAPEAPRGESESGYGVNEKAPRGESETPNLVSALPEKTDLDDLPPAVGDQGQVVSEPAPAACAGQPEPPAHEKRARPRAPGKGRPTPRRRPEFVVSAEAVEVYRVAIPPAVKRYIPEHAVARVLRAITVGLERQAERLGCDDPAEFARVVAERAETWRFRMVDARDPVGVVIGLIVRGAHGAPEVLPWCGRCEGAAPARRFRHDADGRAHRCPDCHPSVAELEAGGRSPGGTDNDRIAHAA